MILAAYATLVGLSTFLVALGCWFPAALLIAAAGAIVLWGEFRALQERLRPERRRTYLNS